jgi:serine/threonine protein kinase
MARELLNWGPIPDLTKCDVFSLGITVFELYTGVSVEANGSNWHMMRSAEYTFPANTPDELMSLLNEMMAPEAVNRPSAKACLHTYDALKSPLELELQKQTLRMQSLEERLNEMTAAEAAMR